MNYFQRSHSRQSALDDSANPIPLDHAQWEKERERNWNRPRPKPFPHSPSVSLSTTMRRRDSMESLGSAPRDSLSPSYSMFGRRKRLESTSSGASNSSAVETPSSALAIAPASRHGKEKPPGASLLSVSSSQLLLPFRPSSPTPGDTAASRKSTSPIPSATSTRIRTLSTPATLSKEKEREKETHWNRPIHARARSAHTAALETSPKQNSTSSAKGVATSLLHRAQNFGNPSKKKDEEREREAGENSSLHEPARSTSPSPTQASSSTGDSLSPIPYGEGFPRERKRSQTNGGTPFTSSSRGPSFRDSLKKVFKWSSKESSGSGEEPRASNPSSTPSRTKSGGDRDSGSNSSAELPAPDPIQPPGLGKGEGPTMSESEVESKGGEGRNSLGSIPRLVSPTTTPRTSPPSTTPTTTPSHRTSSIPSRIPRASRVVAPGEPDLNSSGDTPSHANGNRHSLLPAKTPKFPSAWETPAATPAPTTSGSTLPTTPFTPFARSSRSGGPLPPYETPAETPVPEQASGVPSIKVSIYQTPAETSKTSVYQTPVETPQTSVYQTPAETAKPSVHQLPAETPVSRPDGKAPQTPAPPSGWMTTPRAPTPAQGAWSLSAPYSAPQTPSVGPSSLKRNDSHQKLSRVRFDRSPSTSSIVNVGSGSDREMDGVPIALGATVLGTTHDLSMPRFATGQTRDNQQRPQSSQQQQQQHQNGGSEQKRLPDERERTPYRPPRLNVVDPFGRDIYAEDGAPIERLDEPENEPLEPLVLARPLPAQVQATNGSSKANGVASKDEHDSLAGISARRREKMRVDDAQANLGERSVEPTVPGDETPKPLDTNAAIKPMREGLSELENDTADESSSGPLAAAQPLTLSEPLDHEERIKELNIQSESSRIERSKITEQSQLARINSVTSAEEEDQLRSGSSSSNHGHRSRSSTKSDAGSSASSAVRSETAHTAQEPWWRPSYMLALLRGVVPYLAMEWAEYRAEYLFLTTHFDVAFPIMEDIPGFHWYSLPFPPSSFATRRDYHHL